VGIMSEDASPDEYFCEQCRKDLHKIYTAANGYVQLPAVSYVLSAFVPSHSAVSVNARPWRRSGPA
jgi:hypothetical protein